MWDLGVCEGENKLCAAGAFCCLVNVFLHYQEALLFPEACALMGLDRERNMRWNRAPLFITLGLQPRQNKWSRAQEFRGSSITIWDKKMEVIYGRLLSLYYFLMYKQVSSIEKHYPFTSGDPAEHCVLGFLFSLVNLQCWNDKCGHACFWSSYNPQLTTQWWLHFMSGYTY